MKKLIALLSFVPVLLLFSCAEPVTPKLTLDAAAAKGLFGTELSVTPADEFVTVSDGTVIIAPKTEDAVYTLSGYFNGQIITTTKNTVLRLENVYLENTGGKAALKAEAKTEVSVAGKSTNYIVSGGKNPSKTAALQGKRTLILGGSGTLYVQGNVCHGVQGEDVKIKGSGTFYFQGTKKGSALNCKTLEVESEKTFCVYLLNSKNGIKADRTISIASGNFYIYDNDTALKTDTSHDSAKHAHAIMLNGGTFYLHENARLFLTEPDAYHPDGAVFIEE